jgi:alginate O-acetyltransferase complex protein AlgJ
MKLTRTICSTFVQPVVIAALVAITLTSVGRSSLQAADAAESFLAALRTKVATAERENQSVLAGKDGWLFFVPELRSLSIGPFWGEQAKEVSRSSKPNYADPLPAIVDFNDQLKKAGIELLVVPVPAKAAVYADRLAADLRVDAADTLRFDPQQKEFYDLLGQRGVEVVDLLPLFTKQRDDRSAMYCQTDTHWSGAAVALATDRIVDRVRDQAWFKELSRTKYETETRELEIAGDLARMLDESQPAHEKLSLSFVGIRQGGALVPVQPDRESPVLLMGDSHTLVFHDPELFARGAGLPDHLALQLGVPVDLVGVRGSGATTTRIELLRRRDNLKGKKLVVWCFSFREFTESFTGWRKVPVIR